MAHESFEDPETAKIMNENFVNVKVDREERPDIDKIYMTYVQAITGGGGWPMSVWMTPNLRPIVGGTYFPPRDSYGRRGFPSICLHIAKLWQDKREELESQGEKTIQLMNESVNETRESTQGALTVETLKKCYEQIARGFDPEQGGFSQAPKFPRPVVFNFLLQVYAREGPESIVGKTALNMTTLTLRKMGMGGMFDHLGGGFHRYSVTPDWHVPHFEKMLYDQGQLATVYLDVFRITRDKFYETKARDVLNYVLKSLTSPEGGIFSAEDADSLLQHGKPEHAEGAFYVWTMSELESILGPQHAQIFNYHFGVKKDGNSPPGGDPHGEFVGKNILIQRFTEQETAQRFGLPVEETIKILAHCKQKLYELRDKRPHPHLDDKIIAGWNGLMISAYARAYQVLGDPTYLEAGRKAAQFIKDKLYNPTTGKLIRNYRNGPSNISGFTDDYAFLIHALIELYEASADISWLKWAVDLQEKQNALFWDNQNGGYFAVEGGDASLLIRMKEDYDGAEPCNNSVSALNLLRLGNMLEKKTYKDYAERTFSSFASTLEFSPVIIPFMCVALDFYLSAPQHVVIAGKPEASDTSNLLSEIQKHFQPNKVLLYADQGEGQAYLSQTQEIMKGMGMVNGKATAYVCENYTCNLPITDPQQLAILLSKKKLSF